MYSKTLSVCASKPSVVVQSASQKECTEEYTDGHQFECTGKLLIQHTAKSSGQLSLVKAIFMSQLARLCVISVQQETDRL